MHVLAISRRRTEVIKLRQVARVFTQHCRRGRTAAIREDYVGGHHALGADLIWQSWYAYLRAIRLHIEHRGLDQVNMFLC